MNRELDSPVMHVGWDRRVHNALTLLGVVTWRDLFAMDESDFLKVRGIGRVNLEYVRRKVAESEQAAGPIDPVRERLRAANYAPVPAPPITGVYFIRTDAFVKIGMAGDIRKRLTDLETASPFDMQLLAYIRTEGLVQAQRIERELHKRFRGHHHRREWFRLEPPIEEYIAGIRATIASAAA